jgi:predicted nucleic acid-binding Zn ribbon protein
LARTLQSGTNSRPITICGGRPERSSLRSSLLIGRRESPFARSAQGGALSEWEAALFSALFRYYDGTFLAVGPPAIPAILLGRRDRRERCMRTCPVCGATYPDHHAICAKDGALLGESKRVPTWVWGAFAAMLLVTGFLTARVLMPKARQDSQPRSSSRKA